MRNLWQKFTVMTLVGFALLALTGLGTAWAKGVPVGMLIQVKGDVSFSKDGQKWKALRRNKMLFSGYQVKTGAGGSGRLLNPDDGTTRTLAGNSLIQVVEGDSKVLAGNLSAPSAADSTLISALKTRFSKAQRYTTVRRGVKRSDKLNLRIAPKVTLSAAYPVLVWDNPGSKYGYSLIIDGKVTQVASTEGEMVRHKIPALTPGEHSYQVEVLEQGKAVFTPRKPGTLTWLTEAEEQAVNQGKERLTALVGEDALSLAGYMEEHGLLVAAMDLYREHMARYSDENEVRPLLIKAYHQLKLKNLKNAEALRYNELINQ